MDKGDHHSERYWEQGWDEHEREQLLRLARLPLAEKLAWLEQAHRLVRQLQNAEPGKVPKA